MSSMTPEEVIGRGIAAQTLLNDPTFQDVLNTLGNYHTAAILGSTPDAKETREHHYTMIRVLQEITEELALWVSAKNELEKRIREDEEDFDE